MGCVVQVAKMTGRGDVFYRRYVGYRYAGVGLARVLEDFKVQLELTA